ncbi:hypothetical protein SIAM614_02541 [Stappia aggregata IAM 12614]|uniref:Membrane protein YccC n=1 Tax=Roseibium aggregatum (strain ATCC 25650 / DSM 13394 / JCM 20685 / NBRC 16684 / NCIMB 2208 / IAM 12614 / B1) TaxID=384765 RepID=A0NUB7_ROSAI|nr:FUSC family protein [Roseibium aggregatum]EAV43519.1 hypothetical protein SIAM614_02541 [Stappia aggregata IAM 12614] [Roseibium aggregatum IAM 12614]
MSEKLKIALRTALAMVLAFGIALAMGWDKPYWAGLAVAVCSMSTDGEALQKGLLRIYGTLCGICLAFLLLIVALQDRWLFIGLIGLIVAISTYMMGGTRRYYFWSMLSSTVLIVGIFSGSDAERAFEVAVLRSQETLLGVICYTLVSIIFLSTSTSKHFLTSLTAHVSNIREYFERVMGGQSGEQDGKGLDQLRAEIASMQTGLHGQLDVAQLDSVEIWEARRVWRKVLEDLAETVDLMEHLHLGRNELSGIVSTEVLPEVRAFTAEISRRLDAVRRLIGDGNTEPGRVTEHLDLEFSRESVAKLSHFQRAAITLGRDRLVGLDRATGGLLNAVAEARGQGRFSPPKATPAQRCWIPDPRRLLAGLSALTACWIGCLCIIYIPALPSSPIWVMIPVSSTMMAAALMPFFSPWLILKPVIYAMIPSAMVHILLMPHLEGFLQLAVLLFAGVFLICWFMDRPEMKMARSISLILFVVMLQIGEPQHYSFTYAANFAISVPFVILIISIARIFPVSFRPEVAMHRLLRRFFDSAVYLLTTLRWDFDRQPPWFERQWRLYHRRQIASLPSALAMCANALPDAALGKASRTELTNLISTLEMLGNRMQDLVSLRDTPQALGWVGELKSSIRNWRLGVQEIYSHLAENPDNEEINDLKGRLQAKMAELETQIQTAMDKDTEGRRSEADDTSMYRVLGAYRGVSETLLSFVDNASRLDWTRLRETRF